MTTNTVLKMNKNNIFEIIAGVMATILLGAIGSGLWEKLLSPFLDYTSEKVIEIASYISNGYLDRLYSNAPNISYNGKIFLLFYLVLIFFFFSMFIFSLHSKKENETIGLWIRIYTVLYKGWFAIILWGALLITCYIGSATTMTAIKIDVYSNESMEILRPFIGEKEYLILRSEYLRVDSKDSYILFNEKLKSFSSKYSIKINEYEIP